MYNWKTYNLYNNKNTHIWTTWNDLFCNNDNNIYCADRITYWAKGYKTFLISPLFFRKEFWFISYFFQAISGQTFLWLLCSIFYITKELHNTNKTCGVLIYWLSFIKSVDIKRWVEAITCNYIILYRERHLYFRDLW